MRQLSQPASLPPEASARAARLAPYLGAGLAAAAVALRPRDQDLFLAASHLAGVRYAIATYLPQRLVERQLHAERAGPWLEWVEGALLFADVSGSTALAERLGALGREGSEIVTETLNSYFGTMIRLIQDAGGDLLTFGGDALLVLFDGPEHARAATATALALLRELAGFARSVPGVGAFPLRMHIGVAAGRVALVSAGQPHALRYSAMGATVAAVARAEAHGGKGELVLDPAAWAAVAPDAAGSLVPGSGGFVRVSALRGRAPARLAAGGPAPAPALTPDALDALAGQIARLSPYLPADLLARIVADPTRPRVEADLRPVSVLFAQVAGLAPLVERLSPDRAAAAVDAFLRPMQAAVEQFGGFVNKLDLADEGDKLMAVFGAPVALEDHAERAARAALAMQAALPEAAARIRDLSSANDAARPAELSLRIGLNTGTVFAGNVGTPERKEYTVMGDAVNVAARVMAYAAWGEIRCAAATAAQIGVTLATADPVQVTLRGKGEPATLLRLAGERERAQPAPGGGPLIGRERELAWLREQLAAACAGQGRAVRVSGEAGVGKSRLAAALVAEARAGGAAFLSVRCLAFNSAAPYAPWGDLLRDLCGIGASDGQEARASKLAAALAAAAVDPADWLPLVADLARLDAEDSLVTRALDPQLRQARRFEIVRDLLRAAAAGRLPALGPQPALVVLFDNLHWADQISLDLWQYVAGDLDAAPLLLLGLHRGPLGWGSGPQGDGAAALDLGPLAPEASAALLDALAAPGPLDPQLREHLVARAAGNPLFLEELLRAVGGGGDVDALPDSLSGLLLARIDRLDERSRTLLRVASVVGQRFPVGVVHSVHERDYDALVGRLAHLDAEDLTALERDRPERVHIFRHALLQEVAYQSLLYARRRELHRRIGAHLEERYADDLAAVRAEYGGGGRPLVQIGRNGSLMRREARANGAPIFLIAHHFRLSDAPERATPYLLLAGHLARDGYANGQALQHYRWALEAIPPGDPRAWEAREALGDVLCILGRYEEAIGEYAAILADELPPAVAAEVLRSLGDALEKQGRYAEALERLRAAEARCKADLSAVPPLLLSAIYADMGQALRRLGQFDEALEVCRTGLAMVRDDRRSAEDERIEADLQMLMATLYATRGDYDQARFHFENALAAQEAIDDLYGCARSHNNLGYLAQLQADYARAVRHYGEVETLARKVSAKYILGSVLLNAAYVYFCLSRYDDAEGACRDARALCEEMGDQLGVAQAADTLGMTAYQRGDYDGAAADYLRALAIYREQANTYQEGNTLALLARVRLAQGDIAAAKALAGEAWTIGRSIQAPQHEVEALTVLADAELRAVRRGIVGPRPGLDEAQRLAAEAAALAERLGSRLDYGVARRLQGEVAAARGEPYDTHFAAALDTFAAIKSVFEQARAEARYGEALAARNNPAADTYLKRAAATFNTIGADGEARRLAAERERS
jgi:class 3 adenylate cyclase/tetratricopeptide (TPR) repeat protein